MPLHVRMPQGMDRECATPTESDERRQHTTPMSLTDVRKVRDYRGFDAWDGSDHDARIMTCGGV